MSDFIIFASKFFIILRTQFSIFSSFKGTYQRNKCTFKKMVKYHIFFFTVRPVRFLYLCIEVIVLPTSIAYNYFFFQRYKLKYRCTFKNKIKSHIFIFYSASSHIALSLHQSQFSYSYNVQCFLLFKVPIIEILQVHFQK